MTPLIVIQARLGSTRLPRKVLLPLGGKPALQHTVERAQATGCKVVVACPTEDAPALATLPCWPSRPGEHRKGISSHAGDTADVLRRYAVTAEHFLPTPPTHVLRLTGDCPLIDPDVIGLVVDALRGGAVYASNTVQRTYPRGLDVEGFTVDALRQAHAEARDPYDREHVTPWMQRHLPVTHVKHTTDLSKHRWCLDDSADYAWLEGVFTRHPNPTTSQVLAYRPHRYDRR